MTIREKLEHIEKEILSPLATLSSEAVRERPMAPCEIRTAFGRDRDRILHSKAFRRLKHKTQVFLSPEGDHYRTRLTHTLEVSQIARTVARALRLNEDLTEAIALGHDLGHTPYGHAGEYALNECCPHGFRHAEQSVRVLRFLENDGEGLNLTTAVLNGIACHTGGKDAETLEGRVVRFADKIAYMNHDFEDAARAGIINEDDIPWQVRYAVGRSRPERINSFVQSLVDFSADDIRMAPEVQQAFNTLRAFMFEAVYKNPIAKSEENKAIIMLQGLYTHFISHTEQLPPEYRAILETVDIDRAVCDYISGMSDGYAVNIYESIFVPPFLGYLSSTKRKEVPDLIPESFIEELKYRSDIEQLVMRYTNLKRGGRNLSGLCPFHSEKTPSFMVYPESNSFYCFGCGAGGDIVTFVRMAEHLEYIEALRFLAEKVGMSLPDEVENDGAAKLKMRMLELNRQAARFFNDVLNSSEGRQGMEYFQSRGLSPNIIRKFGLGYAPDSWDCLKKHLLQKGFSEDEMAAAAVVRKNDKGGSYDQFRGRVMFPIIDLRGGVIGFGGRVLSDARPKYLNSSDTAIFKKSRGLFALNFAKSSKRSQLILCEGYMDAIAIHQAGFDNAVATLGTSLTPEQARLIAQYTSEIVISYDSDVAGQKATQRAGRLFSQTGVKVRVLVVSGAKDPDEYIKKYGAARFAKLIEGSANSTEYQIMRLKERFDINSDDGKISFLKEFCALMANIDNTIEADVYTNGISSEFLVSREAILQQTAALRKRTARQQQKKYNADLKIYSQQPNQKHDPQRAANLRYALAEDKLIVTLIKNPDYVKNILEKISPKQFVTDFNRDIFSILTERLLKGRGIDLTDLASELSVEQMNRLSHLLATNRENSFSLRDASDYIAVIEEKQHQLTNEQVGDMTEDELNTFIQGIAAKKNPNRI